MKDKKATKKKIGFSMHATTFTAIGFIRSVQPGYFCRLAFYPHVRHCRCPVSD
jgi:hypothetical protein